MFVKICLQHEVEIWLRLVSFLFEGTNTLIILDDCAASKDVKGRTGQLANLVFSAQPIGISVWVLTQKMTSITASFQENVAAIVLFYTFAAKTTKAIFDDYAGLITPGINYPLLQSNNLQNWKKLPSNPHQSLNKYWAIIANC